jgi:hypothetical protein
MGYSTDRVKAANLKQKVDRLYYKRPSNRKLDVVNKFFTD